MGAKTATDDGPQFLSREFVLVVVGRRPRGLFATLRRDYRARAVWYGYRPSFRAFLHVVFADGSLATLLYRSMRWAARLHLQPLAMILGKLLTFSCGAVIGRGADLGPGLVLLHPVGVVINTSVVAGANCVIESCVTIGAEKGASPRIGDHVFFGSGAKAVGDVAIGSRARIGANAVVVEDVPPGGTAVGVPARVVRVREEDA